MPALNPEHLLDQADRLLQPPPAGPPRQVDLRRAVSSAYYAVFHAILTAAADEFVGVTRRTTSRYGLVYRSIDHRRIRDLCDDLGKPAIPAKYAAHTPAAGFGTNISAFAAAFPELQDARHSADYDPMMRFRTADAQLVIRTARTALRRYGNASAQRRKAFLTLLLFPPRR